MITSTQLIKYFNLLPHPEGGYYKETYRCGESIQGYALPIYFTDDRSISTAIYFLLEDTQFSSFHRIKSDEMWHFYEGGPLHIYIIHQDGNIETITLGRNFEKGETFQAVVPAGCWFASQPADGSRFSFAGCTVAPGFDFNDFELAGAGILTAKYPDHAELIKRLCRS